jgi:quercetin dioxygenase-like cupin family protein
VRRGGEIDLAAPVGGRAVGFRRARVVAEKEGSVHTGFAICELEAGGAVAAHVHSFEESVHVLEGEVVADVAEGSYALRPGDYAVFPVGFPHAWRNLGAGPGRWVEMAAPQPRAEHGEDTFEVTPGPEPREPVPLVYSGITVKMMIDRELGAECLTMFMVQYEEGGLAGAHDHPFEETYMILEGEVDALFDGEHHRLGPGDVAWAGVGCLHAFANPGPGAVRWLETQAPQPPGRHSYRFARDWDHLRAGP